MIKTKNKLSSEQVKKLESLFANDFSSPVFPLLAEHYYNTDDYYRAKKVCEIGLSKNATNVQGMFVLAKIFYKSDDLFKSERLIQRLLKADPINLKSLLLLFEIQKKLNRTNRTILKTISLILRFCPNHMIATKWMENNTIKNLDPIKKRKKDSPQKNQTQKSTHLDKNQLNLQSNFHTFSMINILITQKHYQDAMNGLKVLVQEESTKQKAEKLIKKIKKIIKKENEKNISK